MNKNLNRTALAVLTLSVGILAASCAPQGAAVLEVKAGNPTVQPLERTVEVSGVLAPERTAAVFGKLSGQASKITVDVGSKVRAGDVLLEIDAHELKAQLALADAAVATAKQQAAQALVGIDSAQTNYDQAKRYVDRLNSLEDRSALSKNQLDDAQSKVELTQRALESAKLQYKTASEAGLNQALANADVVRSQIENSVLRSPIDGVITNRNINPGEMATPSAALFTVADLRSLKLQGTVAQDVVSLLPLGAQVTVNLDGMAGNSLAGRITQVGPVAAAGGQYFPVVVTIDQPGKALAGMTARAVIEVKAPEAPALPVSAVVSEQGRAWVFVVADGVAKKTEVGLGMSNGKLVQVVRGLKGDEVVAESNVSLLADGTPVTLKP